MSVPRIVHKKLIRLTLNMAGVLLMTQVMFYLEKCQNTHRQLLVSDMV